MTDRVFINGKWRDRDGMSRANYDRITRELPTESMRALFVEQYSGKVRGGVVKNKSAYGKIVVDTDSKIGMMR